MEPIVSSRKRKKGKKRYQLRSRSQGHPGTKVDVAKAPAGNNTFENTMMRSFSDAATAFCRKRGKKVDTDTPMEELVAAFGTATFISGEFICQRVFQYVLRQRLTCIFHLRDVFEC